MRDSFPQSRQRTMASRMPFGDVVADGLFRHGSTPASNFTERGVKSNL